MNHVATIFIWLFYLGGQAFSILKRAQLAHIPSKQYLLANWLDLSMQVFFGTAAYIVVWRDPAWVAQIASKFLPVDPQAALEFTVVLKANVFTAAIFGYFSQSIIDWIIALIRRKAGASANAAGAGS